MFALLLFTIAGIIAGQFIKVGVDPRALSLLQSAWTSATPHLINAAKSAKASIPATVDRSKKLIAPKQAV